MRKRRIFRMMTACVLLVMVATSCNKPSKLEGTKWEGDWVKVGEYYNSVKQKLDTVEINVTLTISFSTKDAYASARVLTVDYSGKPATLFRSETAHDYTYEKGKVSLEIEWKDVLMKSLDDGKWTGTAEKKAMTLKNASGRTVTFTKK